ncbi:MAG: glucose-6-phosphate isomerase, partial [Oricola sp.]|nr:glucose-6-phosphate isomerase [Oricola sp.]
MTDITQTPEWKALEADAAALQGVSVRSLFETDPARYARYSLEAAGLFLDYSKNKITEDVADHLVALAMAE